MQKHILVLCCCLFILSSFASVSEFSEDLGRTSKHQVSVELKRLKHKVPVNLYTNPCLCCKVMDKKTYANQKVTDYLVENCYTVKTHKITTATYTARNYNPGYNTYHFSLYRTNCQKAFSTTTILTNEGTKPPLIAGPLAPNLIITREKNYFDDKVYLKIIYPEHIKHVTNV